MFCDTMLRLFNRIFTCSVLCETVRYNVRFVVSYVFVERRDGGSYYNCCLGVLEKISIFEQKMLEFRQQKKKVIITYLFVVGLIKSA